MLKRNRHRGVGVEIVLAATLIALLVTAAPGLARQEMSAGEAGDPGDGEEVFSGGSGTDVSSTSKVNSETGERTYLWWFFVPMIGPGVFAMQVLFVAKQFETRR